MSDIAGNMTLPEEPSSFRLIATLGVAGFLSGLILVSVYLFTEPMIAQNKADALKTAIFKVLPGTTHFVTLRDADGKLVEVEGLAEKGEEVIYLGLNDAQEMTGFAIPGAEPGFQDIIAAIYGYEPEGTMIIGFEVLESKETPGLGDKIFKDADFQTNFSQLDAGAEIEAVKKGEKSADSQVEAITGATISSKAIVRLLNKSISHWRAPVDAWMESSNIKKAGGS